MWDVIVLIPDHCLSFYFVLAILSLTEDLKQKSLPQKISDQALETIRIQK